MYGSQVIAEFKAKQINSSLLSILASSIRNYSYENMFEQNPKTYDAFEKDVAAVEIFFSKPTIIQIGRKASMTWLDYLSAVGGLLGLVLGMGFVTFVELFWVCLRLFALKLNLQNLIT